MIFSEEEITMVKQADLVAVAAAMGYTPKRIGRYYTLKEMDSIRIYNRSHWYRWSSETGGSQIDFVMTFAGMEFKNAVEWLLDFIGYKKAEKSFDEGKIVNEGKHQERKEFRLPDFAGNNKRLYQYLMNERGISREVIDYFVSKHLIYESRKYHNVVFVGTDCEGTPKFASMRGTFDQDGKAFKCDVGGNDKNYGFHRCYEGSDTIVVFEAAIDLLSYLSLYPGSTEHLIALGMVADAPLVRYLEEHDGIMNIRLALDNDNAGRTATENLTKKYYEFGYQVEDISPPEEYKDYNEWLQGWRQGLYQPSKGKR